MGKTASGTLWVSREKTSAYDFFQAWINSFDEDVERSLAKLMLNSLYGKFGMNDSRITKIPVAIGDTIIYRTMENNTTYYYKEVASYIEIIL